MTAAIGLFVLTTLGIAPATAFRMNAITRTIVTTAPALWALRELGKIRPLRRMSREVRVGVEAIRIDSASGTLVLPSVAIRGSTA